MTRPAKDTSWRAALGSVACTCRIRIGMIRSEFLVCPANAGHQPQRLTDGSSRCRLHAELGSRLPSGIFKMNDSHP